MKIYTKLKRQKNKNEIIRIISARLSTKNEGKQYEK